MGGGGVVLARAAAQRRLLACAAALLLAGSGLVAGSVVASGAAVAEAVTDRLLQVPPAGRVLEVSLRVGTAADVTEQVAALDTAVRDDLAVAAAGADDGLQVAVHPVRRTGLVPTLDPAAGGLRLVGMAYDDLPGHATLTAGAWPTTSPSPGAPGGPPGADTPVPVALHDAAARALAVAPGDVVPVDLGAGPVRLLVTGTYQPDDAGDPVFGGRPLEVLGAEGTATVGPFVPADPAVLGRVTATWRVAPDLASAEPGDLTGLARVLSRLASGLRADPRLPQARISDPVSAAVTRLADSATAARVVGRLPVAVLGAVLAAGLLLTGRQLADLRRGQRRLLRARGLSGPQGARWALAESALVAVPAVAVAGPAAWMVLRWVGGVDADLLRAWPVAAATALVGAVLLAVPGVVAAHRWRAVESDAQRAARARAVAEVVLLAGAAVALWQVLRQQAAAEPGTAQPGPAAPGTVTGLVAAVLLGLVAGGVLAARVAPLAGFVPRAAASGRGGVPWLVLRETVRRPGAYQLSAAVVAVTVGAAVLAVGYGATWTASTGRTGALAVGAYLPGHLLAGAVAAAVLALVAAAVAAVVDALRTFPTRTVLQVVGAGAAASRGAALAAVTSLTTGLAVGAVTGWALARLVLGPLVGQLGPDAGAADAGGAPPTVPVDAVPVDAVPVDAWPAQAWLVPAAVVAVALLVLLGSAARRERTGRVTGSDAPRLADDLRALEQR